LENAHPKAQVSSQQLQLLLPRQVQRLLTFHVAPESAVRSRLAHSETFSLVADLLLMPQLALILLLRGE
jgi:hypothetical protein